MSCSTMPAQFGSSIKPPAVSIILIARSSRNTRCACANGEKKSRFRSSVATYINRILRHRINSFQNSIGVHFGLGELEVAPPHVDRRRL